MNEHTVDAFVYTVMWKGLWNVTNISFYPQITFLALLFLLLPRTAGVCFSSSDANSEPWPFRYIYSLALQKVWEISSKQCLQTNVKFFSLSSLETHQLFPLHTSYFPCTITKVKIAPHAQCTYLAQADNHSQVWTRSDKTVPYYKLSNATFSSNCLGATPMLKSGQSHRRWYQGGVGWGG